LQEGFGAISRPVKPPLQRVRFDRAIDPRYRAEMQNIGVGLIAFLGGFAVMVLEVVGARYLTKDFGGSFYVWVSQIGVVLIALAIGYYAGGALADRYQRLRLLTMLLCPAGLMILLIPNFAGPVIDNLIMRHPIEQPVPAIWQKLDPVLGSSLVFLVPCIGLASVSPCLIRLLTQSVAHVGRVSGWIIAASTVGSIAGVFVSGYVLIDYVSVPMIFRVTGIFTILLGLACWGLDRHFVKGPCA
jgi:MFS family permease